MRAKADLLARNSRKLVTDGHKRVRRVTRDHSGSYQGARARTQQHRRRVAPQSRPGVRRRSPVSGGVVWQVLGALQCGNDTRVVSAQKARTRKGDAAPHVELRVFRLVFSNP